MGVFHPLALRKHETVHGRSFICVTFSALSNAAQRKIAYERGENIFVAEIDGSHAKKITAGALPDISPDGTRIAFTPKATRRIAPVPSGTLQSPTSPAAK
jgi:Tol biopolymer transport system component